MTRLTAQQVLKDKQTHDPDTITSLSLTHKALSDVSCLGEFKNLERLDLAFNSLTSLDGLERCVNLKWLSVVQNKLQSLKGIEALSKLTVLNAGKNKIKSIDEVKSLVSLRALILNDNEIVSICKLDQLKELNTLVLSRNPIREIGESLLNIKSITKLSMSNCKLETIGSALKSCTELKELRLAHNDMKSLPAELACNKKLQNLDLGNNVITRWSDMKVLSSLVDLKNLNLQGNLFTDMEKLAKKVRKMSPNLHIFNARPVDKITTRKNIGRVDEVDGFPHISSDELEVHKEEKKDFVGNIKLPKHKNDRSKNSYADATGLTVEKDLQQENKNTKGLLKKDEVKDVERDDNIVETKGKRKKSHEKQESYNDLGTKDVKSKRKKPDEKVPKKDIPVHKDDTITSENKSKSRKSRKEQDELDIIDNGETSFADLFAHTAAAESLKHGSEKKRVGKAPEEMGGLVSISSKKKKKKNQGVSVAVQLSPSIEVGMGGPSTWGDE